MKKNENFGRRTLLLMILFVFSLAFGLIFQFERAGGYDFLSASLFLNKSGQDKIAPQVDLILPRAEILYQPFILYADAVDNVAVWRVEFVFENQSGENFIYADDSAPYMLQVVLPENIFGALNLRAEAIDLSGNRGVSQKLALDLRGKDQQAPVVTIKQPASGSLLRGAQIVLAEVDDDNKFMTKVDYFIDEKLVYSEANFFRHDFSFDSMQLSSGGHLIKARVTDPAGNQAFSQDISVIVDNDRPELKFLSPADQAVVSGDRVLISAGASDVNGIERVDFLIEQTGIKIASDKEAPYEFIWNSWSLENGLYDLKVSAYDKAGNSNSRELKITVDNDHRAPDIVLNDPPEGARIFGKSVSISAGATDQSGVERVQFYIDDEEVIGVDFTFPYNIYWDSTSVENGRHKIKAKSFDVFGNSAFSQVHDVKVVNPR